MVTLLFIKIHYCMRSVTQSFITLCNLFLADKISKIWKKKVVVHLCIHFQIFVVVQSYLLKQSWHFPNICLPFLIANKPIEVDFCKYFSFFFLTSWLSAGRRRTLHSWQLSTFLFGTWWYQIKETVLHSA